MLRWFIPLIIVIIFELIADIFAKEWSLKGSKSFWFGAISAYIIGNIFWLYSIGHGSGLARGAVIFSVATATVAMLLGIIWFKESFSKIQLFGAFLGIISLVLILWAD